MVSERTSSRSKHFRSDETCEHLRPHFIIIIEGPSGQQHQQAPDWLSPRPLVADLLWHAGKQKAGKKPRRREAGWLRSLKRLKRSLTPSWHQADQNIHPTKACRLPVRKPHLIASTDRHHRNQAPQPDCRCIIHTLLPVPPAAVCSWSPFGAAERPLYKRGSLAAWRRHPSREPSGLTPTPREHPSLASRKYQQLQQARPGQTLSSSTVETFFLVPRLGSTSRTRRPQSRPRRHQSLLLGSIRRAQLRKALSPPPLI